MNPDIKIKKLRNRRTGEEFKLEDVRQGYDWESVSSVARNGSRYKIYLVGDGKPIPPGDDIGFIPPIWEGKLNDAPVSFYSKKNGEIKRDIGKAAAGLHSEWGEGIYHVQTYNDMRHKKIQNLFKPALVKKII